MMLSLSPVTAAAERKPDILRHSNVLEDQKFPGMDYRHFKVLGGAAECRDACRVESQCRAWTYNPSREVGGVRVPTCWLKSGIPQREYARGYVSGIKPPPPAVKADGGRPPLRRDEGSRTTPPPPISAR
jgi:hypothetical protein